MKMKYFGLCETKSFHFHRIFNSGKGVQTPSGSTTVMYSQSPIKHGAILVITGTATEASGDSFEIGDGRILIYSSVGVQNSIL